ncbi:MAG: ATP-binding cassette domain-containing protein [Brachymonas sp.]|nr:ATP-binding cassette domain-containing protein [Brachymonas sp.]
MASHPLVRELIQVALAIAIVTPAMVLVLRSLAGLHTPTDLQGHIRVGGQDWLHTVRGICLKPQARRVGLVFQHYALFPHLNAIDNIALCADSMPASGQISTKKQALTWLESMGLAGAGTAPVQQLSGGQQQRVALARRWCGCKAQRPRAQQAACCCSMSRFLRWMRRCGRCCIGNWRSFAPV